MYTRDDGVKVTRYEKRFMGLLGFMGLLHIARMFRVVAKVLLGCSEWFPGSCYAVPMVFLISTTSLGREGGFYGVQSGCQGVDRVFRVVSRVLLCSFYGVFGF